jgi:methionine sulfoxide reductase heme-binding subunit
MDMPVTWFLMRATGIVALVLLSIAVAVGVAGPRLRPTARLTTISMHATASLTGTLLLVGHIFFAVIDKYIDISLPAVFVPGVAAWSPLWVSFGTVAFDLLLLVMVSSAMRHRGPTVWRRLHLLSYPMFALAWGHALTAGSDDHLMWLLALGTGGVVALAVLMRLTAPARPAPNPGAQGSPDRAAQLTGGIR